MNLHLVQQQKNWKIFYPNPKDCKTAYEMLKERMIGIKKNNPKK